MPESKQSLNVLTPTHGISSEARVSDLLLHNPLRWNVDLIKHIFWEEDEILIYALPLGRLPQVDRWIWHYDSKGAYIVRSAYYSAITLLNREARMVVFSLNHRFQFGNSSGIKAYGMVPKLILSRQYILLKLLLPQFIVFWIHGNSRWIPPSQGFIKINLDGAVHASNPSVGAGVIASDWSGNCLQW
ncbi:hypothetical protein Sango_2749800 [Sesamum angolense]|uniref:RNase H type-1 domain-containing protein n=1 Tax=Sesamum angolense TaxID=2727404 RepID=A0AAE1T864_9LAMI|nr:hypothetical protein Sango_2749800 [Sesamum angolense]